MHPKFVMLAYAWVLPVHDYTSDALAWVYNKMGRFREAWRAPAALQETRHGH